jgi:nucleoside diphosphate kinase
MNKFKIVFILIIISMLSGCLARIGDIEKNSEKRFHELGFEIIGREGTQLTIMGGARWYVIKRIDGNGVYDACLEYMLSGDLGVWNLKSVDAISVNNDNTELEKK